MHNIIIIGAGQLGSRHLQSLGNLKEPATITVVDPFEVSLEKAKHIFTTAFPGSIHTVNYVKTVAESNITSAQVAIIATNSLIRRKVIEGLVEQVSLQYLILEKFLFPKLEDYTAIEILLNEKKIKTWVNCPRRMFPVYQQLKKQMGENTIFTVAGTLWGLGCNGIHMVDLAAYLTGEHTWTFFTSQLDNEIIESKRDGYIEFTGGIAGVSASKQNSIHLLSSKNEIPFVITIQSGTKTIVISEADKKIVTLDLKDKTFESSHEDFSILFQSQLTSLVVEELLTNGSCKLTPYAESKALHLSYLNCLLEFQNKLTGVDSDTCLIT